MKTRLVPNLCFVSALGLLGLLATSDAEACVTCDNQQCKATQLSGALDCTSGWFFGHYCNLSGDCHAGSIGGSKPVMNSLVSATSSLPRDSFSTRIRGPFGTWVESTNVEAEVRQSLTLSARLS